MGSITGMRVWTDEEIKDLTADKTAPQDIINSCNEQRDQENSASQDQALLKRLTPKVGPVRSGIPFRSGNSVNDLVPLYQRAAPSLRLPWDKSLGCDEDLNRSGLLAHICQGRCCGQCRDYGSTAEGRNRLQ